MCEGHNVHVQCMVYLTDAGGEDKCTEENWIRQKEEETETTATEIESEQEPQIVQQYLPQQESNLLKITSMYKWVQVEKTLVRNQVANVAILNHLREH